MNDNHFDVVLAGNYLTTVVAALGLAQAGKKVCVVNPTPAWGGHFTKLTVNGIAFDPGAVSHEFTVFNERGEYDALQFDPRRRNDVARFNGLIEQYTRGQIELARMEPPATVYRGQLHPDIVMTNHFEVMQHPHLAGRVRAEQAHIAAQPPGALHPRDKKNNAFFLQKSYYDASLENHGATLHAAIFEPQFYKMSNLSSTRLIALYHRIAWLPVYYPETLLAQYAPQPQVLPETYFSYPKAGYIGHFGEVLVQRMQEAGVTVVRDPIAQLDGSTGAAAVTLKDGRRIQGRHLVWSLAHDQLYTQATGKAPHVFERWSAMLVFATVQRERLLRSFSVLYCPDDDAIFYRACNQTASAGQDDDVLRVVFEVNPDYAAARGYATEAQVVERLRADLCTLGLLADPQHLDVVAARVMKNVLLLPSHENSELLAVERDALLLAYPGVTFTRNVDAFFADTLNDQIVKGLKVAEQLKAA